MELSRIVVGIDFSAESEIAAKYALKIARHTGAEVVLVHVGLVPDKQRTMPAAAAVREWERIVEEELTADRKRLEELRERLAGHMPDVSHMVIDGFADTGLCEAAKQLSADLVVIGTHGRTGIKRFLMGSVAERIVRMYEHNVLVARPGAEHTGGGFRRILVPTDFSPHAEDALKLALVLAAEGGNIDVCHYWNTPPELALDWSGPMLEELAEDARISGKKLLEKHFREDVTMTFEAARARPVEGIQDRIEKGNYDLVVMGSYGRRGLRRLLLGSVTELTIRHASCSVLVVHRTQDD